MLWLRESTPADSRFLVLTGPQPGAWLDSRTEWFPALTRRRSLATVQGSEWLGGGRGIPRSIDRYEKLQLCGDKTVACLEAWSRDTALRFTHVVLPVAPSDEEQLESVYSFKPRRDCCAALRYSIAASGDYTLIFENEAVQIYALE
jgi:hypothetical protein